MCAITFTGDTDADFPAEACFDDPGGISVGMPGAFGNAISGWDADQICLLYNSIEDTLYVGIRTFDDPNTTDPIPFGDADGDGDPGGTSATLAGQGGADFPDLQDEEYFSFIHFFSSDFGEDPEVISGISVERTIPDGYRVSEVALPHPGVSFSLLNTYYGSLLASSNTSAVFASPSPGAPHLEFTITDYSLLPGFPDLDQSDPDETIGLIFKAGSLGDDGIGDEDVQILIPLQEFFDDDGDDIPNNADADSDNDGVPDITENGIDEYDTNGDCLIDDAEATASGLDGDGDGDLDANDFELPDTDGDGTPDYLDTDSDDDTILDIHEADTFESDANDDLSITPDEFAGLGCIGEDELTDTDGDGIPDMEDDDSDGDGISDADEAGDTDPTTPPVDTDGDGTPDYRDLDSDDDGLSDEDEILIGTDPLDPDTDDDAVPDGADQDPLTPGPGADPDINVADSGNAVQTQGSGLFGCGLSPASDTSGKGSVLALLLFLMTGGLFILLRIYPVSRRRLFHGAFFFIVLTLMAPVPATALNVEQFRPTFDTLGLFNIHESRSLPHRGWSAGVSVGFEQNPLELGLVSTGERLDSLVDYFVNMNMSVAYGVNDWFSIGVVVPFFPALRIEPVGTSAGSTTASFGDIAVAAKFHLWQQGNAATDDISMGAGIVPFITFPSGDSGKFTGDATVTGGFTGIYDIQFWKNLVAVNLGFRFREKENLFNLTVGQELLYGVGYHRPIWEPWDFHGLTEINGSTTFNGFATRANRSPLEWLFGLRKGFWESRVHGTVGAGLGLTNGYGTPDYRVFGMVTYAAPPIEEKPPERYMEESEHRVTYKSYVRVEGGQIVILEPIHFETAKWAILPESQPVVQAVADLMNSQPWIRHVVIQGHTDHRGSDPYNMNLSDNRANEVRLTLIEKFGVDTSRLSSEGRGERQPIDTNETVEGMANNRRVEFHIVEVQKMGETESVTEKTEEFKKTKGVVEEEDEVDVEVEEVTETDVETFSD